MTGPRNVKTNRAYKNAVMRARNAALRQLAINHPAEYQRLLAEERVKQGLAYRRKPRPAGVDPALLDGYRPAWWVRCDEGALCRWKGRRIATERVDAESLPCPRCDSAVTAYYRTYAKIDRPRNTAQSQVVRRGWITRRRTACA